jgi:predicted porin
MKKSLLALAALSAIAGAAQAQSSVTVYGILDVGFVNSNYSGTGYTANTANVGGVTTTGSATTKQTMNSFGQSAESSSRLGFKGSEDLGGGTSAIFTVEMSLQPNTQDSTTNPSGSFIVNRQSFLGLNKKGLGSATIGTQYTPLFDVQSATDAAGNNNLVGNAVYSSNLQTTGVVNDGNAPYGGNAAYQSLMTGGTAYTTRVSNALKLQSDRISGFQGELFYAQANDNLNQSGSYATTAGGPNNNTAWGLNADYIWKKLQVVAAYQGVRSYNNTQASAATAPQTGYNSTYTQGVANSFGLNMNDSQTYAAATYDFGVLKAYYQFVTRKVASTLDSSWTSKRTANQIGVRSQLTPVISAYATFGLTNSAYWGQGLPSANGRTYQVGVDYYLSKRTNLYVAGGGFNQSSNGQTTSASVGAGSSASNYAVGIRHTF